MIINALFSSITVDIVVIATVLIAVISECQESYSEQQVTFKDML